MRRLILEIAALLLAVGAIVLLVRRTEGLRYERDRYKGNVETLLFDVETYRVRDSLSGARVESLELTLKEYERFRADDAALIQSLRSRNRDLAAVNKTQSQTLIQLSATARDTVIVVKDSIVIPAVAVHCGDPWYDFDGLLAGNEFSGQLHNRDSLVLIETVKYKRFLGFLWKTKRIKDRKLEVVSRNPHTEIIGLEYISITP